MIALHLGYPPRRITGINVAHRGGVRPLPLRIGLVLASLLALPSSFVPALAALPRDTTPGILAWGTNYYGELGTTDTLDRPTPTQVVNLTGVSAIAAGPDFSLAVRSDGSVWSWGDDTKSQLGTTSTQLCQSHYQCSSTPVQVFQSGISAVAGGGVNGMALATNGIVFAWGENSFGQLGNGGTTPSVTPVQVQGISGVKAIAVGGGFSMALKQDGTLWTWGANTNGELGIGSTDFNAHSTPQQVTALGTPVIAIAAGNTFALAVTSDSKVWAWGNSLDGDLGVPFNQISPDYSTPQQVAGLSGATTVSAGGSFALALVSGAVYAWGNNDYGELGNGSNDSTNTGVFTPTQVAGLSGVTAIAAGASHSVALTQSGSVYAWGHNNSGQLGTASTGMCTVNGTADPCSTTPLQVSGASGATAIATGDYFTLAIAPVILPTPTPTNTPVPPTPTASPVPPTVTPVPPTVTPVTPTRTSVPATTTNTPVPPTAVPTAVATVVHRKQLRGCPARFVPLSIPARIPAVPDGGTLSLAIRTATGAHVTVTVRVTTLRRLTVHHKRITRTVVLYDVTVSVSTGHQSRENIRVRIHYPVTRPVTASVVVIERLGCNSRSAHGYLTITPRGHGRHR